MLIFDRDIGIFDSTTSACPGGHYPWSQARAPRGGTARLVEPVVRQVERVSGDHWFLPPIFGFYFAWKLVHEGQRIDRVGHAFLLGLLGVVLNQLVEATVFQYAEISVYSMLVILWTVAVISAYLQYLAWPALCKTLLAYGVGARIPVVVIMFLALRGHWGTHHDHPSGPFTLSFWPTFLLFGFFEELVYWVSFTVAMGSLAGSIAAAVAKRRMRQSQSAM
jgi:hypothetical protein